MGALGLTGSGYGRGPARWGAGPGLVGCRRGCGRRLRRGQCAWPWP
ncbi:hypothetical protein GZL_05125 [Streptomyces sp. 769]|nr:hypothetical protein GZL_05125 [Streptomyces sp. 769]